MTSWTDDIIIGQDIYIVNCVSSEISKRAHK